MHNFLLCVTMHGFLPFLAAHSAYEKRNQLKFYGFILTGSVKRLGRCIWPHVGDCWRDKGDSAQEGNWN